MAYQNPLKTKLGADFFARLPRQPGVYYLAGAAGRLLYVGKAKDLRKRVTSYALLKPGVAGGLPDEREERMLELVERVAAIRWETFETEDQALAREAELLRVLQPPYNRAGTDEELYLYIGLRKHRGALEWRLSNWLDFDEELVRGDGESYRAYGAFRNRARIKEGYTALLRLLHAAQCATPRFHYPARICRSSPPWQYRLRVPAQLERPLHDFLAGRSRRFLPLLVESLLANEHLPPFMRPSVQDDLETALALFDSGPGLTRRLRQAHDQENRARAVSPEEMRALVEREVLSK